MNPTSSSVPITLETPQVFLQHLVVAEPWLEAFGSILATSSLRESPDDRISSLPLRPKHQQLLGHSDLSLRVLCVLRVL